MATNETANAAPDMDLNGILEATDKQRSSALQVTKNLQVMLEGNYRAELDRLTTKYGNDHPMLTMMQSMLDDNSATQQALDVEMLRTGTDFAASNVSEWRMNGWVRDEQGNVLPGIKIFFVNTANQEQTDLGLVFTDAKGYYSIAIGNDMIKKLGKQIIYLSASANDKIIYRSPDSITPSPGELEHTDVDVEGFSSMTSYK